MELGRGLRKKTRARKLDSASESDDSRENKRIKHKLEKKIPSPPQILFSEDHVHISNKDSSNRPKYSICKQLFPQKMQINVALQEKKVKDLSYESDISTGASVPGVYHQNSKILEKLEQVKTLKKQTYDKKKTIQSKINSCSHNKNEKSLRIPDVNNEQNTNSTFIKPITKEYSSSSTDPDLPDSMISKSSERRNNIVLEEGNYHCYLILVLISVLCFNISFFFLRR